MKRPVKRTTKKHTTIFDLMILLTTLDQNGEISQQGLADYLNMSKTTVTRLLRRVRDDYGVIINRPIGSDVKYIIADWGLFDREAVYKYLKDAPLIEHK